MAAAEPNAMPDMLAEALEYLRQGYPVFPVCSPLMGAHDHYDRAKKRDAPCPPDKRGKNPMVRWKDCQDELPEEWEVRSWWTKWPNANIGFATGSLSGVLVLDADGTDARKECLKRGGLDETRAVWTGKVGGAHFHLAYPGEEVRNFARRMPGTDLRGEGGYALLPPSLHTRGARYRWVEGTQGVSPAPTPEWLLEVIRSKAPTSDGDGSYEGIDVEEMLQGFDEGGRDDGLFRLACRFRHDDQPRGVAEALIRTAAANCRPPFDEDEAIAKVHYVYQKYEAGNVGPTVDDDGWFSPTVASSAPQIPPEPMPAVFFRPISELLAMPEVDPDYLVDQLFTVGSNGWVAAEPKVGKSWVVLELAYALSTGMPFLGRFSIKHPRRVLYVQEEDSLQRVLRRLKQIIKGDTSRVIPSDDYWRWSIRVGFKVDNLVWLEKLRQEIISFSAEVIILDVFNRLHGSDENKQAEMTAILNNLTRLSNDYGCAFIIVHHNRKPQAGNEARGNQRIRGSGVLGGWGECSLYLNRSKDKDTIIVTPESKDTPEMDDFTITLEDQPNGGVFLQMGDVVASEQSATSKADEAVIEAVERVTDRGVGATVQLIAEALGKDRTTVQKRLTKLVEGGYLECMAISSTNNPTKIYSVVSR